MYRTISAAQTRAFGARLAEYLHPGDVLLLDAPMGAGKSELARGLARGLGIQGPVPSPTYTILQAYDTGHYTLYHFDLYRLTDPSEFEQLGFEELLRGDGVCVLEWPERAASYLPARVLRVRICPEGESDARFITLLPEGGFPALPDGIWEEGAV